MRFPIEFAISVLLIAPGAPGQSATEASAVPSAGAAKNTSFWRTVQNCGANCLFLMLKARGENVSYEQVLDATPIGPRGSTLPELAQAAADLGFEARIGRGKPEDLLRAELPIMIHLDASNGDRRASGHFVLVTGADPRTHTLELFDGTSALKSHVSLSEVQRTWSGFVFELRRFPLWAYQMMVSVISVAGAVWIACRRRQVEVIG